MFLRANHQTGRDASKEFIMSDICNCIPVKLCSDAGDFPLGVPVPCTQSLNLYVRSDGDDSNDGLADSPERACLTLHGAYAKVFSYRAVVPGVNVTLHIGPGTFQGGLLIDRGFLGTCFERIYISGSGADSTIITGDNQCCFQANKVYLIVRNVMLSSVDAYSHLISHMGAYVVTHGTVKAVGKTRGACFLCRPNSYMDVSGDALYINASAEKFFFAEYNSHLRVSSVNTTLNGSVTSSTASCGRHGSLSMGPKNLSGMVTGRKFYIDTLSLLQTGGKGENYIPGTIAGYKGSGAIYI